MYRINFTGQMSDEKPREIITNDNLNAAVDAQIYFTTVAEISADGQKRIIIIKAEGIRQVRLLQAEGKAFAI